MRKRRGRLQREIGKARAEIRKATRTREAQAHAKRLRAEAKSINARARLLAARAGGSDAWATPKTVILGIGGIAAGAAGAYFLDRADGKRRRRVARDKALSFARRRGADLRRTARYRKDQATGVAQRATPDRAERALDDATLAAKVRSEVLRPPDIPAGSVNVNVEEGVVFLRGELEDRERIERLVETTAAVEGVAGVESLLHLPGEPAPTKGDGAVVSA